MQDQFKPQRKRKWTLEYQREYMRIYRITHRARMRNQRYEWKRANPKRVNDSNKQERLRLKELVLSHYGLFGKAVCVRCGFSDIRALCLDHIEDNGAQHRRMIAYPTFAGTSFYRWIKKTGFPSGFQTLCANCNLIKEVVRKSHIHSDANDSPASQIHTERVSASSTAGI